MYVYGLLTMRPWVAITLGAMGKPLNDGAFLYRMVAIALTPQTVQARAQITQRRHALFDFLYVPVQ